MNRYPRETKEPVLFETVFVDAIPETDFEYALTQGLDRPTEWLAPVTTPDGLAFLLDGTMREGYWKVWALVTMPDNSQVVIEGPRFVLT
jgi:hypothetical protein